MDKLTSFSVFGLAVIAASVACSGNGQPVTDQNGFIQSAVSNGTTSGNTSTNSSAKAVAAINTVTVCASAGGAPCTENSSAGTVGVWQNVMSAQIKTSSPADLFISPSLVTGIYTSTTVTGNNTGSKSSATAMGGIQVRVLIDGVPGNAYPDTTGDGVTFEQRIQTLSANLGNVFTSCFADGGTTATGCTLTPEQITLVLQTTSAHSFNFIALNVGSGTHTVTVQAQLNTSATGTNGGLASAYALYGLGSLTVDSVRMVNNFSF